MSEGFAVPHNLTGDARRNSIKSADTGAGQALLDRLQRVAGDLDIKSSRLDVVLTSIRGATSQPGTGAGKPGETVSNFFQAAERLAEQLEVAAVRIGSQVDELERTF